MATGKQNKEDNKNCNNEIRKTEKTTKSQKIKQYELNKRRASLRKQYETIKEIKQYENKHRDKIEKMRILI